MNPNEIFGSQNNDTGFVSFEEMENAFKAPTQYQNFYEQPETPSGAGLEPSDDLPPSLVNPEGEDLNFEDHEPKVDHEHAMRTGERIARIIDTGIDFTLSNFVARNGESYKADEKDLEDIAECWGEISQEHNWNIGPEWTLAILYIMVYGPLVKQAVSDRRMAELEARQKSLEEQMKVIQMQQHDTERTNDGGASRQPDPSGSPYSHVPQP